MSMCMMPLLIKAKMTYGNYYDLLLEAAKRYRKSYLKENYRYDGEYFTLDVCEMDDYHIFAEAKLIAKYASLTGRCVGLIFDGSTSYSTAALYFQNGKCVTKKLQKSDRLRFSYERRKQEFLSGFPKREFKSYPEVEAILTARIEYDTYQCVGMSRDVLAAIFKKLGYVLESSHGYEGEIEVRLRDCEDKNPNKLIADYFGYENSVLFCGHGYLPTPNEIMILLYRKEDPHESTGKTIRR